MQSNKIGFNSPCKGCKNSFIKQYPRHLYCQSCKVENKKKANLKYYNSNKDFCLESIKKSRHNRKKAFAANPIMHEEFLEKERARAKVRRENPKQRLDYRMSNMIREGLKFGKQGKSWKELVDYSLEDLYDHIESKFLPNMTWDNMSDWHIDHIYPKSKLKYKTENDPEFKVCWGLENLQPLWAQDNLRKSNKLNYVISSYKGE